MKCTYNVLQEAVARIFEVIVDGAGGLARISLTLALRLLIALWLDV